MIIIVMVMMNTDDDDNTDLVIKSSCFWIPGDSLEKVNLFAKMNNIWCQRIIQLLESSTFISGDAESTFAKLSHPASIGWVAPLTLFPSSSSSIEPSTTILVKIGYFPWKCTNLSGKIWVAADSQRRRNNMRRNNIILLKAEKTQFMQYVQTQQNKIFNAIE